MNNMCSNQYVTVLESERLILSWMQPLNDNENQSRTRRAVGELIRRGDSVSFRYLSNELSFEKAIREGFVEFPAFPHDDPGYVFKNCMDVFRRRIPDIDRPDFRSYLESFGINPELEYEDFSLLGLTGGRTTSDSFEFVDPLSDASTPFTTLFDVAGVRHYSEAFTNTSVGTDITFIHDEDNPHDANAIKIVNSFNEQIGWVNRLQCSAILDAVINGCIQGTVFRLNGRPSYQRIYVMAKVEDRNNAEIAA